MGEGVNNRVRLWLALVAMAFLSLSAPAFAQEDSLDDLARRHFESGVAYLQESDYENALKAFEKAYELSKRPEILLNIATVNERKPDLGAAVAALEKYLEMAPAEAERGPIEARLANLKKRMTGDTGATETPARPTRDGSGATSTPETPTADRAEPSSKMPAYVLLGVGGLAAIGAGVTGLIAKGKYDDAKDSCSPNCSDDDVSSGKTMALTSTVLTGVALVSAGIGAVMFMSGPSSTEKTARPRSRFEVGFGVLPGTAAASARYRF